MSAVGEVLLGARVFRTPSHVNESFTAAMVVRSLLAAERSSWVVGMLVGWAVDRLVVCGLVMGSVVVGYGPLPLMPPVSAFRVGHL